MTDMNSIDLSEPKIQNSINAQTEILFPEQFQHHIQEALKHLPKEIGDHNKFFSATKILLSAIVKLSAKLDPTAKKLQQDVEIAPKQQQFETVYPSRKTRWVGKITKEQAKQKYEERKYVAFAFCQHGINYHYITQKYPKMLPKTYRCIVEAVNNETVNQIVEYLRYECNVQIERLNRDQKRSIRTQLTKIKDWLGNKDPQQLETFYKFIYRHYNKQLQIKFEDALKLYKTIIQIIKSPFVNVLQAEQAAKQGNEGQMPGEEDKAILILFIKHKNQQKVSDQICQKYGYDKMENSHLSIKLKLKHYLQAAIEKLISTLKADVQPIYRNYFNNTRRQLLQRLPDEMKIRMYSYYLEKVTSAIKIKDLMLRLRQFYALEQTELSEQQFPKTQQCDITFLTHSSSVKIEMDDTRELEMVKSEQQTASEKEEVKRDSEVQVKFEQ